MKEFIFSPEVIPIIIQHEDTMFLRYQELKQQYEPQFTKLGFTLVMSQSWGRFDRFGKYYSALHRIEFKNGYTCNIFCGVEKDHKLICTDPVEGEQMAYSYNVSHMIRKGFHLDIILLDELEEVKTDLEMSLHILEDM